MTVHRITETQETNAGELFERYNDQDFSFTDCTSFAVMQDFEVGEVFTNDHHFRILGFILIP